MRVIGVDYGSARVGIAIGDTETGIASPWSVIKRESDDQVIQALVTLAQQEGAEHFVVGIPKPLADQQRDTDQTTRVRAFVIALCATGMRVEEENETWSSSLAAKQGIEAGSKGKRDDLAAANILQGWLDRRIQI